MATLMTSYVLTKPYGPGTKNSRRTCTRVHGNCSRPSGKSLTSMIGKNCISVRDYAGSVTLSRVQ